MRAVSRRERTPRPMSFRRGPPLMSFRRASYPRRNPPALRRLVLAATNEIFPRWQRPPSAGLPLSATYALQNDGTSSVISTSALYEEKSLSALNAWYHFVLDLPLPQCHRQPRSPVGRPRRNSTVTLRSRPCDEESPFRRTRRGGAPESPFFGDHPALHRGVIPPVLAAQH